MQTTRGAHHPTRFRDLAVTVDFHCQSACRFCIVQEGMNHYRGVPLAQFEQAAAQNVAARRYDRVIFTGGEVTLEESLFDFVAAAQKDDAFEHVRIQTNARKLAHRAYAEQLRTAGVDELFVSLHGPTAAVQDHISQRGGSFDEAVRGLENANALGFHVVSNTVMNADNVAHLHAMPRVLKDLGARSMELWNFLPMEDTDEARRLIVPMAELIPALVMCLESAENLGLPTTVKYVPKCLLGRFGAALDNAQSDVVIVESFWDRFPRFSCLYEAVCDASEHCLGLHHPYVRKYGWEEQRLARVPRERPWSEARNTRDGRDVAVDGPWVHLVRGVDDDVPGTLEKSWLTRNEARYRFSFDDGASVELVLSARDSDKPALVRSRSFNLFYTAVDAPNGEAEIRACIDAAARSVVARDDGSLSLDGDKGLGREHVRRRRRLPTTT